jgi:ketosteroid isomerase-like protein
MVQGSSIPSLEEKLRILADKEAIREIVYKYCRAVDRRDIAACRELYHPDAVDDHGSYYQGSAAGYLNALPALMAPVVVMQHHITTINIMIDGDYAESEAYGLAIHQIRGEKGLADLVVGTRFLDKFQRRQGEWKIAHRTHALDWTITNAPSRMDTDNIQFTDSPRGRPDLSDPSYAFFRLFGRGTSEKSI